VGSAPSTEERPGAPCTTGSGRLDEGLSGRGYRGPKSALLSRTGAEDIVRSGADRSCFTSLRIIEWPLASGGRSAARAGPVTATTGRPTTAKAARLATHRRIRDVITTPFSWDYQNGPDIRPCAELTVSRR
jgi:hypothetical protein